MATDADTARRIEILDEIDTLTKRSREIQVEIGHASDCYGNDELWEEFKSVGDRIKALDAQYLTFQPRGI